MVVCTLLAVALLLHELLYITRDGRVYLERCFVPTFGLQLGRRSHAALHFGLIGACLSMAAWPDSRPAAIATFVALTLVIASYSLRLSNHLVVGWFMLVVVLLADAARQLGAVEADRRRLLLTGFEMIVVLTYALSAAHKLNRDFFSLRSSHASQLAGFLCWDRGISRPVLVRALSWYSIYSTVAVEPALPALLVVPATRAWGLAAAIAFQFSLALIGIVNFSSRR